MSMISHCFWTLFNVFYVYVYVYVYAVYPQRSPNIVNGIVNVKDVNVNDVNVNEKWNRFKRGDS